jgi:hypothetical protein
VYIQLKFVILEKAKKVIILLGYKKKVTILLGALLPIVTMTLPGRIVAIVVVRGSKRILLQFCVLIAVFVVIYLLFYSIFFFFFFRPSSCTPSTCDGCENSVNCVANGCEWSGNACGAPPMCVFVDCMSVWFI